MFKYTHCNCHQGHYCHKKLKLSKSCFALWLDLLCNLIMNQIMVCKWLKYIHTTHTYHTQFPLQIQRWKLEEERERGGGWKRSEEWLQLYFQCFTCGNTPSPLLDIRGSTYKMKHMNKEFNVSPYADWISTSKLGFKLCLNRVNTLIISNNELHNITNKLN